ncbi:hypothetical protein MA16_Dca001977 [Dendrobium catenatum]|uniref:Amidohydrolase 3 domain-containing protein n=1 Tax=Dendrobium catenatum TaxID=906689 RepID=A0A2I0XE06_9ASPA|nr:hypothetical protein MA16_Dca001977 [Dendrobium catenatum]
MADPYLDYGLSYDEQGFVCILDSTFFDINPRIDHTVEEYVERILDTLVKAIEEQLGTVDHEGRVCPILLSLVNPDHILDDASSAEKKIGKARAQKGSYLFRSLLTGGAKLAFGSDWPVADIDPLRSIKTAITRIPPGQETAWIPSERVELDDALNAYTIGAAYACFLDNELGSLSPGKYADFIVLPSSSWEEFKKNIPSSVSATYVSGLQAYP